MPAPCSWRIDRTWWNSCWQKRARRRLPNGGTLAGYIAYEAGLALEPKLRPLADARSGAAGPLVWLGLFEDSETISPGDVPDWLAAHAEGSAALGPLEPQVSPGAYAEAFEKLQEAIRAGDIYQANLTLPLAGSYRGDPVALYAHCVRQHRRAMAG